MTPAARLAAAIEILDAIEPCQTATDSFIRGYFRSRRYAGSKDRRAVTEKVYSIIRHRARLDWWIAGATGDMAPVARTRVLASLPLLERHDRPAIDLLFDGRGHAPAILDHGESDLVASLAGKPLRHPAMPEEIVHEVPAWLSPLLREQWGENFGPEMAALNTTASVDVRVNISRVSRQQARKSLLRDGVKSEYTPLSPVGLRLTEHAALTGTRAFGKGLIEVQDEGSQLIALLCQARPGMTIIDYCAGAGGKTLALADIMGRQGEAPAAGRLIACDVSAQRLGRMEQRLKRAGIENVEWIVLPADDFSATLRNGADRVLVDAPCSGLGTWRRHPQARWRLRHEQLQKYITAQREALESAAMLVKPGGRLIYATCSLLGRENEDQVEWLLSRRQDFATLPMGKMWRDTTIAAGTPGAARSTGLYLSPASTGTDGFYCAVLGKNCE